MAVSSTLGVASGLDLSSIVTQLVSAQYDSKISANKSSQDDVQVKLSAVSKLSSALKTFSDSLDTLADASKMAAKNPTITNTDDIEAFTADTTNSASVGSYDIEVLQLAKGSTATTADGTFSSSSSVVSSTAGTLTFSAGSNTFSINVKAGMTVDQLRTAVNNATDNFGITANIVNTGDSSVGSQLVFSSSITGDTSNNLVITNNNSSLDSVSTVATGSGTTMSVTDAQKSHITIDGTDVYGDSNELEGVISNVTLNLLAKTKTDSPSTLKIGTDEEDVQGYIEDFVKNYNTMMDVLDELGKSGTYTSSGTQLTDGGDLSGDSLIRGLKSQLSKIVAGAVSGANTNLNTLYSVGISMDSDGNLEITDSNTYGGSSGEDRLDSALSDQFDNIASLFSGDNGIAGQMQALLKQYTQSGNGLLAERTTSYNDQLDQLIDQSNTIAEKQTSYEEMLTKKYTALDTALAQMQQSSSYITTLLSSL
ncbi:flagellar filament capping protein FliD [Pokkaliibacter sp. MBI-7]|uniref:flagellar filament capping protein FliD n=1 Tax=Pokkaliibacter sp. MBI-7 TaxID=3040600 RepID=UPI00244C2BD6|nr:flagellar filament capping protein FliD [Pokkaliibacter sp. MBI-7]MDH2431311.1 flagellar filament capping protein FliD [Pokkaliibacter sp. MBI-7]